MNQLKFTGVKAVKESQLRAALATTKSSKLPWGAKHYFTREQFDADLKRATAFYRDRGYPDAKVKTFDVKLNPEQDGVDITVDIDEGQPIVVEAIEYKGFEVLPPKHLIELKDRIPLKTGQPLDRALAQVTRESALDEVKDHGYPYASVRLNDRAGGNEHSRILTIAATPGTLARYDRSTSSATPASATPSCCGSSRSNRAGVTGSVTLKRASASSISSRPFSSRTSSRTVPEGQQPELVPTKITVTEGKHRKVNFGLGYGSEEHLRTKIDWRHVNFFGGARTMQLIGQDSSLDRGVRLNFKQPAFPAPRYGMTVSGQWWHNDEPAYVLDTQGGSVTIERPLARPGPDSQRRQRRRSRSPTRISMRAMSSPRKVWMIRRSGIRSSL